MNFLNNFWDSSPNGRMIILGGAAALMLCGCALIAFSAWGFFFQGEAAASPNDQSLATFTPGSGGSGIPTATLAPTLPSEATATPTALATGTSDPNTTPGAATLDPNAPCNCAAEEDAPNCEALSIEQAQACVDYCAGIDGIGKSRGTRRLDRNNDGIACNGDT